MNLLISPLALTSVGHELKVIASGYTISHSNALNNYCKIPLHDTQ